jgi:hypothetical protein
MTYARILHDGVVVPAITELLTGRLYLRIQNECCNYSRKYMYYSYVIQIL